ncbi:MAG TPA: hypothetical protein VFY99_11155 [Solirubrobacterales bacterium]
MALTPARWALLIVGVLLTLGGLGVGLPQLLSGDHEEYGRVDIPGKGTVDLPAGEVVVFYEDGSSPADGFFPEPDVKWRIAPTGGGKPLRLDSDGGRESNVRGDKSWTDIEGLDIEDAGEYDVEVAAVAGGPDPALTFGTSGVTTSALLFVIVGAGLGTTLIVGALAIGRR